METIYHYHTADMPTHTMILEKSFGIADVTVLIKQKPGEKDVKQQEYLCVLTDELSNLLNDSQWEELLK